MSPELDPRHPDCIEDNPRREGTDNYTHSYQNMRQGFVGMTFATLVVALLIAQCPQKPATNHHLPQKDTSAQTVPEIPQSY